MVLTATNLAKEDTVNFEPTMDYSKIGWTIGGRKGLMNFSEKDNYNSDILSTPVDDELRNTLALRLPEHSSIAKLVDFCASKGYSYTSANSQQRSPYIEEAGVLADAGFSTLHN